MSLSNILTGSPWNLGNTSITIKDLTAEKINGSSYPSTAFTDVIPIANNTYNIGAVSYKFVSGHIKNIYSDYVVAGTPAQSGTAFLTVGNTSDDDGIRFLNNKTGYTPTDLNAYSELNQAVVWTSQQGTATGSIVNSITRIGNRIFITIEGFQITDTNSENYTMSPALPSVWRPIKNINVAVPLNANNNIKIGYLTITTAGEMILYYITPEKSSGSANGLFTTTVNFDAAV